MIPSVEKINVHWFRRDLRLEDNTALHQALRQNLPVLTIFIFDTNILEHLPEQDARVTFIHQSLERLNKQLTQYGSRLMVFHSTPELAFQQLLSSYTIEQVFTNHDYEPYGIQRDLEIKALVNSYGCAWNNVKDQVIFEKSEVTKEDGLPYTVYTPYSKKWKSNITSDSFRSLDVKPLTTRFLKLPKLDIPTLKDIGFEKTSLAIPDNYIDDAIIRQYHETRDYPSLSGTSKLGIHLRFGTISIRTLMQHAVDGNEKFYNELIWREFYQQILFHFPQVVTHSFKPAYDRIPWRNHEADFQQWCKGMTGYPIVDAGMRQLNETGWMHNRVRMIVASFLTKHLLIDWRWGEAYFAEKLLDFELASNNGGWQWAAGCGVDAAPYFRIFNPRLQTLKFDPQLNYIRRWVPEFDSLQYVSPMVDHDFARKRCLEVYKHALAL